MVHVRWKRTSDGRLVACWNTEDPQSMRVVALKNPKTSMRRTMQEASGLTIQEWNSRGGS